MCERRKRAGVAGAGCSEAARVPGQGAAPHEGNRDVLSGSRGGAGGGTAAARLLDDTQAQQDGEEVLDGGRAPRLCFCAGSQHRCTGGQGSACIHSPRALLRLRRGGGGDSRGGTRWWCLAARHIEERPEPGEGCSRHVTGSLATQRLLLLLSAAGACATLVEDVAEGVAQQREVPRARRQPGQQAAH